MTYAEFIGIVSDYVIEHAPVGEDTAGWRY
jgi:hypothetical protein